MTIHVKPQVKTFKMRLGRAGLLLLLAAMTAPAFAIIPSSERSVLVSLYNNAGGPGWYYRDGWNGPAGTECSWYGISCNTAQTHVTGIFLVNNHLVGVIPPLVQVYQTFFGFGLTYLQYFDVSYNDLTGTMPNPGWMPALQYFSVHHNHLTGEIPHVFGYLANLQTFYAQVNQLTGEIPQLAGLSNLVNFDVSFNGLTYSIPEIAGLSRLRNFRARNNWGLNGSLPSMAGLTSLQVFDVSHNSFVGPIPSLADLRSLAYFDVSDNWLSGSLPALAGLSNLWNFNARLNELTGSIPSLDRMPSLSSFQVGNNQLTGLPPAPPERARTTIGGLWQLCPNRLTATWDPIWNTATGITPWYRDCW